MSAKYSVFRNPVPGKEQKEGTLHARLVKQNIIRIDDLSRNISEMTSFSSGDVKGMLEALRFQMELYLESGDMIELEGLGTFNVALKCPSVTNEKKITPGTVKFGRVTFRCSKKLTEKLKNMEVKRDSEGSRLNHLSPEKRKANILKYLETYQTISTYECRSMNYCSKHIALKDFSELLNEGKIIRLGSKQNAQYALKISPPTSLE